MEQTTEMHQSMIDLFKDLGDLAEYGSHMLDQQQPGSRALAAKMMEHGAELYARIDMHPRQVVTLYLTHDGNDMMLFQLSPVVNPRWN